MDHRSEQAIVTRAIAIWLVLLCAEILHGIARAIVLVPFRRVSAGRDRIFDLVPAVMGLTCLPVPSRS